MHLGTEEEEVAACHDVPRTFAKGVLALVVQVGIPLEMYQVIVN